MAEHVFGGNWTEIKLARLRAYLNAYRNVFIKQSYFTTWYVDAFAGTGSRSEGTSTYGCFDSDEAEIDPDTSQYFDGSAKIALGLDSPFHRYLFIEKSRSRVDELRGMIADQYPSLVVRCEFRQQDANSALSAWIQERNWTKERAVVFLDPYGMQVEWQTVKLLGETKAIDLWYLFPLGVARLLTRDGNIDGSWQNRLDLLFGTGGWREHFYKTSVEQGLFGEFEVTKRDAKVKTIQAYIESRLKTSFSAVAPREALNNMS